MNARLLCQSPPVVVVDDFATAAECADLARWLHDPALPASAELPVKANGTGLSFELPAAEDPIAAVIVERLHGLAGATDHFSGGSTLRMRRYSAGQAHPRHGDHYAFEGLQLAITALVVLEGPEAGGETLFPSAVPGPLRLVPRTGRLLMWQNVGADRQPLAAAEHLALAVRGGTKATATLFIYLPVEVELPVWNLPLASAVERRDAHLATPADANTPLRGLGRRLAVVDDDVPVETLLALRDAADQRGVATILIDSPGFDFAEQRRLRAGDLLYRPAVSAVSARIEQFLWTPGVADLYARSYGVFFDPNNAPLLFERRGLPVARTYWPTKQTLYLLPSWLEALGGLPVVVKILGFSGGQGVIRVDSLVTLRSLLGALLAQGNSPLLCAYVPDAVHWRVFVVGDKAVGGYRNVMDQGDFRTSASDNPDDYRAELPPEVCTIAVAAARAIEFELAGVDILSHPSGRHYLLEANFPCYFGHAQENGQDIAGALLDHLLDKSPVQ
jgi:hypothetical protein